MTGESALAVGIRMILEVWIERAALPPENTGREVNGKIYLPHTPGYPHL